MNPLCLEDADLALLDQAPPDSPMRRHIAECARCRARALALSAFLTLPGSPAGSQPAEADARLAVLLDREINQTGRERMAPAFSIAPAGPHELPDNPEARRGRALASLSRFLRRPALRPVWALGLLLLAVLGVREFRDRGRDESIILRQGPSPSSALSEDRAVALADGRIEIFWRLVPGADHYVVELCGDDLKPRVNLDAGNASSILLSPEVAARVRARELLFWRVVAQAGGDELNSPQTLPFEIFSPR